MDVQLVDNEYPARLRVGPDRAVNVPAEVFVCAQRAPRRTDRRCDHLALGHIPVPDQTDCAMTPVFKLDPFRLARLHGDRFRNPLQRLHAGHLVDADRVCIALEIQLGSFLIRLAHDLDLTLKHLRILFLRVEPVPAAMRLQRRTAEVPVDLTDRDAIDDSPF